MKIVRLEAQNVKRLTAVEITPDGNMVVVGGNNAQGGIVEKEAPVHLSNVMIVCSKCAEPSRVGKRKLEDGTKVRVCKKCGEFIDA